MRVHAWIDRRVGVLQQALFKHSAGIPLISNPFCPCCLGARAAASCRQRPSKGAVASRQQVGRLAGSLLTLYQSTMRAPLCASRTAGGNACPVNPYVEPSALPLRFEFFARPATSVTHHQAPCMQAATLGPRKAGTKHERPYRRHRRPCGGDKGRSSASSATATCNNETAPASLRPVSAAPLISALSKSIPSCLRATRRPQPHSISP